MQTAFILMYIVLFLIAFIKAVRSGQYVDMWKFKNRKKDGSEDDDFKRFD